VTRDPGSSPTLRRPRGRSLFWTFAAAFLVVALLGVGLQAAIVVGVVRPLSDRLQASRLEGVARDVARELTAIAADAPLDAERVGEVLRAHDGGDPFARIVVLVEGTPVAANRMPGRLRHDLATALSLPSGTRWADVPAGGPHSGRRGPGGPGAGPPPGVVPSGPVEGRPGPGGWTVVTRVAATPGVEVVGLRVRRGFFGWPRGMPRPFALFLPVAAVLSVVAGLLLLRVILGRLRALERLAVRVADGDLEVRVRDPRKDEIGRLADALDTMTERLAEARDRLATADRQRRTLLADISHELGTPLTSIRGYAETMLESGHVDDRQRGDLTRILAEASRLDLLIGDLFDLTRLEAGAPLETEHLDWTSLARHVTARFEPRFTDAGLALAFSGPDPAWVDADGRRLEQQLENLLTNALRYVPGGGRVEVTVEAGAEGTGPEGGAHVLTVADDGPGIDPASLALVFDRFYRVDPARSAGGTGLGLAIVKEIAVRHGGRVRAEAQEPRGVRFVVALPASSPTPSPGRAGPEAG